MHIEIELLSLGALVLQCVQQHIPMINVYSYT